MEAADECLEQLTGSDSTRAVTRLSDDEQAQLLSMLPPEEAADLVESVPESYAAHLLETLDADQAAEILNRVESDEQADLLARVPEEVAQAVLERMEPEEAADALRLMQYPPESAGGLMITELLSYPDHFRVADVLEDMRTHAHKYRNYDVQYAYVVDKAGKLVGVLRLRDLVLADPDQRIATLTAEPLSVHVHDSLEDLQQFFDKHPLLGVPVVDDQTRLVGVVRHRDVQQAIEERASRTMLKFFGIMGGEELRTMPLRLRSFRRLSWLSINIVLNVIAASVIAFYQETLEQVIALAVFLPIISDMSGCSGNQAVAVSMRELALGLVTPREALRVLRKEGAVGMINGCALGLLLGLVAYLWKGNAALGAVVAAALALNTVLAACIGGTVPLVLRGLGQDPALASGPILTTVTDMCGFFLVLSFANAALPYLT